MRNYSAAMAGMGLLLAVLTVSAALAGAKVPAAAPEQTSAEEEAVPAARIGLPVSGSLPTPPDTGTNASIPGRLPGAGGTVSASADPSGTGTSSALPGTDMPAVRQDPDTSAAQQAAESSPAPAAEPAAFRIALRLGANVPDHVFLADSLGCPLEPVEADGDGDATLGPVPPGSYRLVVGLQELGGFRLLDNAALAEASGQVWTDGELLHLENYRPGTVEAELWLSSPGLYSFSLLGTSGEYRADLFISGQERPNDDGRWRRTLQFSGLPAGSYRLMWDELQLTVLVVQPGGLSRISVSAG